MITIITSTITFFKVLILFMALLNAAKDGFRLYKSIKLKKEYAMPKGGLLLLGLSISYILALIFT